MSSIHGANAFNAALSLLDVLGIPYEFDSKAWNEQLKEWGVLEKERDPSVPLDLFQILEVFEQHADVLPLRKATFTAVPAGETKSCPMVVEEYEAVCSQGDDSRMLVIHTVVYAEGNRPDLESEQYYRYHRDDE